MKMRNKFQKRSKNHMQSKEIEAISSKFLQTALTSHVKKMEKLRSCEVIPTSYNTAITTHKGISSPIVTN